MFMCGFFNVLDYFVFVGEIEIFFFFDIVEWFELKILMRKFRFFQVVVFNLEGNLFLRVFIGYGKIEVVFLWVNRNVFRNKEGIMSRIFYVLFYKVSINVMYQRMMDIFFDLFLVGVLYSFVSFYFYIFVFEYK